jgi:hypothetical protein
MFKNIFNLEGRRAYVNLYLSHDDAYRLFMWGNCAHVYSEIDRRQVWIHGTFGDSKHSGVDGQYFEVAIDRHKALRNVLPCIEVVGYPQRYPSAESLASARNWVRDSTGKIGLFTYCNLNISFCRSMVYNRPSLQFACWSGIGEKEWTANQIWNELLIASRQQPQNMGCDIQNWIRLDHRTAQHIANLGGFVIACSYNSNGSGHLAFLTEDIEFDSKDYDLSSPDGLYNCLHIKCFHCGVGRPRLTDLIEAFPDLQLDEKQASPISLFDSVRLYCDKETWDEYSRCC